MKTFIITEDGDYFTATRTGQTPPIIGLVGRCGTAAGSLASKLVLYGGYLPCILETDTRRLVCCWDLKTDAAKRRGIQSIADWLEGKWADDPRIPEERADAETWDPRRSAA